MSTVNDLQKLFKVGCRVWSGLVNYDYEEQSIGQVVEKTCYLVISHCRCHSLSQSLTHTFNLHQSELQNFGQTSDCSANLSS